MYSTKTLGIKTMKFHLSANVIAREEKHGLQFEH